MYSNIQNIRTLIWAAQYEMLGNDIFDARNAISDIDKTLIHPKSGYYNGKNKADKFEISLDTKEYGFEFNNNNHINYFLDMIGKLDFKYYLESILVNLEASGPGLEQSNLSIDGIIPQKATWFPDSGATVL